MTAGHVAKCARDRNDGCGPDIVFAGDGGWTAERCSEVEVLDSHDVGLLVLRSEIERPTQALRWQADELSMLNNVWAAGYPYALVPSLSIIAVRSFQGYIVSDTRLFEVTARPPAYELSFHCPRGLSGAALCSPTGAVVGMILGNRITSMTVFHEIETLKEEGSEREVRREEAMHLGVAIKAAALLDLRFRVLDGSVSDWLRKRGLLA